MKKQELIKKASEVIKHHWGTGKDLDTTIWSEPITETAKFYAENGHLGDSKDNYPARMHLATAGDYNYYALRVTTKKGQPREKFFICKVVNGCYKHELQGLQDIRNNRASNDPVLQNLTKKQMIAKKRAEIEEVTQKLKTKTEQFAEFKEELPAELVEKKQAEFTEEAKRIEELEEEVKELDGTKLK